ncbi:MAG: hypothetical protein JWQ87_4706 [Candidatus Sulfotelmatobacter sp.]|nr:hypothetical protein [Candidatus Sulfotelmatobacter sp.]
MFRNNSLPFHFTSYQSPEDADHWPSSGGSGEFDVGLGGAATMMYFSRLWREEEGQDIAEYAVMLAVILVIVVGTVRLIGSNANNTFSNVASSIQ